MSSLQKKLVRRSPYCEKTIDFLFLSKGELFSFKLPYQQNLKTSEIPLFTSNRLQKLKQIRQKTLEKLHFHFVNVLQNYNHILKKGKVLQSQITMYSDKINRKWKRKIYKTVSSTKMFHVYNAAPRPTQELPNQPHRKTSVSTETNPHQQSPEYTQHTPKTGTHEEQAPPHPPVHTTTTHQCPHWTEICRSSTHR